MKKILLCLTIALAIFFPTSFYARDAKPGQGIKVVQPEHSFHYSQLSSESLVFDDSLEDISDDNRSERKKNSLDKTSCYDASFFVQNFSENYFNKISPDKFFSPLQSSLFIFISVLRL
ncbi:MAG: hypothetical protein ABI675_17265 [Chitinophagaceae bacterium]